MNKRIYITAFLAILAVCTLLFSCKKKGCGFGNNKGDCICTMEYDPVCGSNGKTYGNPCLAGCDGITTFTRGECQSN